MPPSGVIGLQAASALGVFLVSFAHVADGVIAVPALCLWLHEPCLRYVGYQDYYFIDNFLRKKLAAQYKLVIFDNMQSLISSAK